MKHLAEEMFESGIRLSAGPWVLELSPQTVEPWQDAAAPTEPDNKEICTAQGISCHCLRRQAV